ncbi:MAG: tetratricopeptide repeat protein [Pyrinomonadaceae bacterium]
MKRFTPILATLFLSLTILSAHRVVSAKDTWVSVRSKNFSLIGNAREKDVRQVAIRLEQFREVFTRLFPKVKFSSAVPTTVIVFKDDNAYRPFKTNANTAGYFQPGPDVNYITLTNEVRGEQDPYTVIFHEYTHLLVNSTLGNAPSWFNEGLAEYYSSFNISDDSKIVLGTPISSHVYLLRQSKMLPLPTLFQVDQQSPYYNERDKQSIFYAQSWALMHYLIHKPEGSASIDTFMKLMDKLPLEQAFQQAFQTTFEVMEKELRAYIRKDRYSITSGKFERKINFDSDLQVSQISEAEAQAYLGDLLLHSNRAESETYLQKALTLDPNQPLANASLAMLRVRQGKIEEARSNLERAITATSQNYLIHYYYAYALSREGMNASQMISGYSKENLAKMREELRQAIALRPDFPESYSLLAFINLVDGSNLDESIAMLKQVLSASPGRNDLALMLVRVYLRAEDFKSARQLLEPLSQNQSDAEVRREAANLLTSLAAQEENLARYREMEARSKSTESAEGPPRLRRGNASTDIRSDSDSGVEAETNPFAYLQEALRTPGEGEKQVQGTLVRLECDAKGIMFVIQLPDRLIKLKTTRFENIQITAFTNEAGSEITCGPRKPQNLVVVCYLPVNDSKVRHDGELRSVEFVPKDFKLKS